MPNSFSSIMEEIEKNRKKSIENFKKQKQIEEEKKVKEKQIAKQQTLQEKRQIAATPKPATWSPPPALQQKDVSKIYPSAGYRAYTPENMVKVKISTPPKIQLTAQQKEANKIYPAAEYRAYQPIDINKLQPLKQTKTTPKATLELPKITPLTPETPSGFKVNIPAKQQQPQGGNTATIRQPTTKEKILDFILPDISKSIKGAVQSFGTGISESFMLPEIISALGPKTAEGKKMWNPEEFKYKPQNTVEEITKGIGEIAPYAVTAPISGAVTDSLTKAIPSLAKSIAGRAIAKGAGTVALGTTVKGVQETIKATTDTEPMTREKAKEIISNVGNEALLMGMFGITSETVGKKVGEAVARKLPQIFEPGVKGILSRAAVSGARGAATGGTTAIVTEGLKMLQNPDNINFKQASLNVLTTAAKMAALDIAGTFKINPIRFRLVWDANGKVTAEFTQNITPKTLPYKEVEKGSGLWAVEYYDNTNKVAKRELLFDLTYDSNGRIVPKASAYFAQKYAGTQPQDIISSALGATEAYTIQPTKQQQIQHTGATGALPVPEKQISRIISLSESVSQQPAIPLTGAIEKGGETIETIPVQSTVVEGPSQAPEVIPLTGTKTATEIQPEVKMVEPKQQKSTKEAKQAEEVLKDYPDLAQSGQKTAIKVEPKNKPVQARQILNKNINAVNIEGGDKYIGTDYWIIEREYAPKNLAALYDKNKHNGHITKIETVQGIVNRANDYVPVDAEDVIDDKTVILRNDSENVIMAINKRFYDYFSHYGIEFGLKENEDLIAMIKNDKVIGAVVPKKITDDMKQKLSEIKTQEETKSELNKGGNIKVQEPIKTSKTTEITTTPQKEREVVSHQQLKKFLSNGERIPYPMPTKPIPPEVIKEAQNKFPNVKGVDDMSEYLNAFWNLQVKRMLLNNVENPFKTVNEAYKFLKKQMDVPSEGISVMKANNGKEYIVTYEPIKTEKPSKITKEETIQNKNTPTTPEIEKLKEFLQMYEDNIKTNPKLAKEKGWDKKAEELSQKIKTLEDSLLQTNKETVPEVTKEETQQTEVKPKTEDEILSEAISNKELPKVKPTTIENHRYNNGKFEKSVLELKVNKGEFTLEYAPYETVDKTNIKHEIQHGFVVGRNIEPIGMAEKALKYIPKISGQTFDIRRLLKENGFTWNDKGRYWEKKEASNLGEKEKVNVAPITGLDYRLALRSAGDYEKLITTRGKRLENAGVYQLSKKIESVLRPHQIDGAKLAIAAIDNYGGFLLADGTGAGKTMQELAVADYYSNKGKVLIVTVNRGIINTAFKNDAKLLDITLNETDGELKDGINIITYASLGKIKGNPDYIIFDESHSLKNQDSIRAKKGLELAKNAKGVLFASATPFDKAEHIKYLNKLGLFSKKSFSQVMKELGYVYEERNIKNITVGTWKRQVSLEEAEQRLNNLFDELSDLGLIVKREVSMDKVTVEFKQIKLPEKVHEQLDSIESYYNRVQNEGLKKALTLMAQRRFQEPYKKDIVMGLTEEELRKGRQVIIFATRIEETEVSTPLPSFDKLTLKSEGTLNTLAEEFEKRGIKVSKIFGNGKIDSEISKFQEGKTKVALVTPQKGGAGLSLDDTAGDKPRTMIVITPPFSAVDNVQMAGRINRLNTKSNSKIIYLIADTPVDEWNKDIIIEKMKTLKAVVRGDIEKLDIADTVQIDENTMKEMLSKIEADEIASRALNTIPDVLTFTPTAPTQPTKAQKILGNLGAQKTEPIKRSEIIKQLSESLDIPTRIGRFAQARRGAKGTFKVKPEVIRTKFANDIETVSHEVGHALDKLMNLRRIIVKNSSEVNTLAQNVKGPKTQEAVAEFMRLYLTNPSEAQKQAPQFYQEFENLLNQNQDVKQILTTAQKQIEQWQNLSPKEKVMSMISIGEKPQKERMTLERFYTAMVDELYPIQKYVNETTKGMKIAAKDNPFVKAWLARGWRGKAEAKIHRGIYKNGKKVSDSLNEILAPVEDNLDDFRAWMISRRALELSKRNIDVGISKEDALGTLKQIYQELGKDKTKLFVETGNKLVKFQNALIDELVESGYLSKQSAAKMKSQNKYYIPFYRVFDDSVKTIDFAGKTFANLPNRIKRIKGSGRDIIDPLESVIKNVYTFTNLAERNNVANSIIDLAEKYEGSGKWVEKVDTPISATKFQLDEIKKILEAAGADIDSIDLSQMAAIFRPNARAIGKENIVIVYRNGKPEMYQLHPDLYRALLFLDEESTNLLSKIMSYPASILRTGAVLNPEFPAKNIMRDQFTAFVFSKYGYIPPVDIFRGLSHVLKKDDLYWQWYESGGAHSAMVSLDRNYLQKSIKEMFAKDKNLLDKAKNIIMHPIDALRVFSELAEEATRVREFELGLKKGASIEEAALASRDITIDFGRAGYIGKTANRYVAFLNAGIQGMDKLRRQFKEDPFGTTFKAIVILLIPTLITYLLNRKNEYYEARPQWEKDIFWLIPLPGTGGKYFLRIPKPFELGIIFSTIPERFLQWADKKDPKAFDDLYDTINQNMLMGILPDERIYGIPFSSGLIPTAFLPIMEVYANRSTFKRAPIVPAHEQDLLPYMQYGPYTTETAKLIGRLTGTSPRMLEHLTYGYTGGLGRDVLQGVDVILGNLGAVEIKSKPAGLASDIPVLKGLISGGIEAGQSPDINTFYEDYNRAQTIQKTIKAANEAGKIPTITKREAFLVEKLPIMRKIADYLSETRRQIEAITESKELSPKEKRRMIEELNKEQINLVRRAYGKKPIK